MINRMNTLIDFIVQSHSKQNLWILFIGICVCLVGFGIVGIYMQIGTPIGGTTKQIQLLDVLFNYSEEDAYLQLGAYGERGRSLCLFNTLVIDSLFPFVYGTFGMLLLGALLGHTSYRVLVLLPLLVIIVDYIENTHTALLLINYPEVKPWVAYFGSIMTSIKWTLIGLILMAISFGFFLKNQKNFLIEVEKRNDFFSL